jgi:hypothetical protein
MTIKWRHIDKNGIWVVLSADEFTPRAKGYVLQELLKKDKYFGNPAGKKFKRSLDAIRYAEDRIDLARLKAKKVV